MMGKICKKNAPADQHSNGEQQGLTAKSEQGDPANKPLFYFSSKLNFAAIQSGRNHNSPTKDSTAKKLIPFIQQLFIHDKSS